jgi:hypothetical protein
VKYLPLIKVNCSHFSFQLGDLSCISKTYISFPILKAEQMSNSNLHQQKIVILLPEAIASSIISLNRCESSLASEQSIEQNNLQKEYQTQN